MGATVRGAQLGANVPRAPSLRRLRKKNKREKRKVKRIHGKNAYQLFMAESIKKSKEARGKKTIEAWRENFKGLALSWRSISREERRRFEDLAARDKERCREEQSLSELGKITSRNLTGEIVAENECNREACQEYPRSDAKYDWTEPTEEVDEEKDGLEKAATPSVFDRFVRNGHGDEASRKILRESEESVVLPKKPRGPRRHRGGTVTQVTFSLWYRANKARIKEAHPQLSRFELMRFSRLDFACLSEEEKSEFANKAKDVIEQRESGKADKPFVDFEDCFLTKDMKDLLGERKSLDAEMMDDSVDNDGALVDETGNDGDSSNGCRDE